MSLVNTDAGVFDPKEMIYMSPVRENSKKPDEYYFTIQLKGVSNQIWIQGDVAKVKNQHAAIIKACFDKPKE